MLQESRGRPVIFWRCPHSLLAVTLTQPPVQWTTYHLFPLCCVVAPHCISAGWIESATFSLLLPAFLSGGLIILSLARLPRNSGPEFNNERRAIIIIISPPPFKIGGAAVQWMGPLGFSGISERFITCEKSCGSSCGMEAVSFLLDREMEMCRQAAGRENISSL